MHQVNTCPQQSYNIWLQLVYVCWSCRHLKIKKIIPQIFKQKYRKQQTWERRAYNSFSQSHKKAHVVSTFSSGKRICVKRSVIAIRVKQHFCNQRLFVVRENVCDIMKNNLAETSAGQGSEIECVYMGTPWANSICNFSVVYAIVVYGFVCWLYQPKQSLSNAYSQITLYLLSECSIYPQACFASLAKMHTFTQYDPTHCKHIHLRKYRG